MIITIDGTSGTGKTTVAKLLAKRLGFSYFDTGAMYRAATWLCQDKHINLHDATDVEKTLTSFDFHVFELSGQKRYFVGARDITEAIRTPEVTNSVSIIAAYPFVRALLHKIQKHYANKEENSVFEGRDMGSAVFPQAKVKIFLTAKPEVRALRRLKEWEVNCQDQEALKQMQRDLEKRDFLDSSRQASPLKCPENAFVFDTSDFTLEEVVEQLLGYIRSLA